ncbi:MAG: hypothetical protein ABSG92_02095 [Conexivisphaerales archaeon]
MNVKMQVDIKSNRAKKAISLLLCISIVGMLVATIGGLALSPAFGATSYDNVQVFVQTTNMTEGIFTIAAYNSSGSLVSSTQTVYPAASFELPDGSYLFTVTAMDQTNYYSYPVPLVGSGTAVSGAVSATDIVPATYEYPKAEYGYVMEQISTSTTLNIKTTPIENITLTEVSVQVLFANGTVAADASVSASVVGAWYWWYGPAVDLQMYAQTGVDGVAQLTIPSVPVDVTAWDWVQVNLPSNQTTVPYNVGGETVNVTVYWEPTYVGLGGSALIIPPQNSATITLHIQQPTYWYASNGASIGATAPTAEGTTTTATPSIGTESDSTSGVPAFISSQFSTGSSSSSSTPAIQTQIPSLSTTGSPGTVTASGSSYDLPLTIAVIVALSIAVLSFALVLLRDRKKQV